MINQFSRTEMLLGKDALLRLGSSRVAIFGVGGVGGYAVEALVRSGIGAIDLIDNDCVSLTNLNRQLLATHKTLGRAKVEVAAERIAEINPNCRVNIHNTFYLPQNNEQFNFSQYDYVVDAIDTVAGKIGLIVAAKETGVPIISAMGAGNKINPTMFEVADIYQTSVCPLAHVMRKELRRRHITDLKVVYSKEKPIRLYENRPFNSEEVPEVSEVNSLNTRRKDIPGSISFVPPVVGFIIASEVIKDLLNLH